MKRHSVIWLDPHDSAANAYLEALLLGSDDASLSRALDALRGAVGATTIRVSPDDVTAYARFRGALKASGQGQLKQVTAEASYRWAKFLHSDDALTRRDLGNILLALGMTDEAVEEYCAAIEALRSDGSARDDPAVIDVLAELADTLAELGFPAAAESALQVALENSQMPAALYLRLGRLMEQQERPGEALDAYREGRRADGDSRTLGELTDALIELGNSFLGKEEPEAAATAYRAVTDADPLNAVAYDYLGDALRMTDNFAGAVAAYRAAISADPSYYFAHCGLGWALFGLGDNQAADESFREAIRLDPDYAAGHHSFGYVLFRREQFKGAAEELAIAIRLEPERPGAHLLLGEALQRLGRLAEAASSYHQAIRLDPSDTDAHDNLDAILEQIRVRLLELDPAADLPADEEDPGEAGDEDDWEDEDELDTREALAISTDGPSDNDRGVENVSRLAFTAGGVSNDLLPDDIKAAYRDRGTEGVFDLFRRS